MNSTLSSVNVTASSTVGPNKSNKVIHLMRHGITEMNVYLTKFHYGSPGFRDPLKFDTRLTPEGIAGARAAASITSKLSPSPQVLIVSPLTRALHTAQLAFPEYKGPIEVEALARERVWLSSDCGRTPKELKQEFPDGRYQFDHLPDIWWYNGNSADEKKVVIEPEDQFKARVESFKQYLMARPEGCIAVVAHWGLIMELTNGRDFENCEVQSFVLQPNGLINPNW